MSLKMSQKANYIFSYFHNYLKTLNVTYTVEAFCVAYIGGETAVAMRLTAVTQHEGPVITWLHRDPVVIGKGTSSC
jgi:hypothetical protein